MAQAALIYVERMVREERGIENGVMLGEMSGKRRRGRPRTRWLDNVMLGEMSGKRRRGRPITRWLDNVNNIKGPSINSMRWDTTDRGKWRGATAVVARGRPRLDGTRRQGEYGQRNKCVIVGLARIRKHQLQVCTHFWTRIVAGAMRRK